MNERKNYRRFVSPHGINVGLPELMRLMQANGFVFLTYECPFRLKEPKAVTLVKDPCGADSVCWEQWDEETSS